MTDNVEIAILTKVNELAEKCGLKPYDFVASVHLSQLDDRDVVKGVKGVTTLTLDGVPEDRQIEKRFATMCHALGVGEDGTVKGEDSAIIDALDRAIQRMPARRR